MRTRLSALLLAPLFLLMAGCNDYLVLTPPDEASFHHRPGHGGGGDGDGGAQGNYEVILLGTLGGSWSEASAGNRAGVVVGSSQKADGEVGTFVWTESEGMVELEDAGGASADLNEGGTLTGKGGVVYDIPTSVLTLLPPLPDHAHTAGIAINDDGWVVGRSWEPWGDPQGVVWVPGADGGYGAPYDLGCQDIGSGWDIDINQRGDVVTNGCEGGWSPPYLWIWNGAGYDAPIALGTLGGFTMAVALDDRGRVTGWAEASRPRGRRAVLWHPDDYSSPIDLGSALFVRDMNNGNQVVGSQSTSPGETETAVVWTVDDAGNAIAFQELPGVSGYPRTTPHGITDEGWIVGRVANDSERMAVVWRPLEDGGENGDGGDEGEDDDCDPHPRFADRCK